MWVGGEDCDIYLMIECSLHMKDSPNLMIMEQIIVHEFNKGSIDLFVKQNILLFSDKSMFSACLSWNS